MILGVYDADDEWVGHIEVNTHVGLFEFEYHAFYRGPYASQDNL